MLNIRYLNDVVCANFDCREPFSPSEFDEEFCSWECSNAVGQVEDDDEG